MSNPFRSELSSFHPALPLNKARTIPSNWYLDEEIYRAECAHVFAATWQVACRVDQVEERGSYVTTEIAGEPIVVVRDEQGILRAFSNVCRHRAAVVMTQLEGNCSRLRCRYHGWTYDLQGRLRGVPEFDGVADFQREEQGLPEFAVDTWGPYVWIHLCNASRSRSPSATSAPIPKFPTLAQYLAPLSERSAALGLGNLHFVERREYMLDCNWKVFVDNFQDGGYHVNTVHPGLAGAIDYSRYRTEMAEHATVQISPLQQTKDETIGKVRTGDAAYYWWIFPNFMVNFYSGVMDAHWVVPLGPERCKIVMDWFFPPFANDDQGRWAEESIAVSDAIQIEDVNICNEVQRGLRSRTYHTGRYSVLREEPVYHFHRLLHRYMLAGCDVRC